MDYNILDNLKYTQTHEWVKIEGINAITGISDYAQHQLGDIVYIELPNIGETIEKGSSAGEIESVKAVGEFLMPLTGKVIQINNLLSENPEIVNQSPYDKGWLIKIEILNLKEENELISADEYKNIIEREDK
ncbi:MAG: glycine cleavage system protein GcvH [Candidatus Lokiarchaeota archaeon]|nr:glycine cleavage system protein GcvH [Candidatus Lokiarchaeota archaeon]